MVNDAVAVAFDCAVTFGMLPARELYRNRIAAIGPRDPAQIAAATEARAVLKTTPWLPRSRGLGVLLGRCGLATNGQSTGAELLLLKATDHQRYTSQNLWNLKVIRVMACGAGFEPLKPSPTRCIETLRQRRQISARCLAGSTRERLPDMQRFHAVTASP